MSREWWVGGELSDFFFPGIEDLIQNFPWDTFQPFRIFFFFFKFWDTLATSLITLAGLGLVTLSFPEYCDYRRALQYLVSFLFLTGSWGRHWRATSAFILHTNSSVLVILRLGQTQRVQVCETSALMKVGYFIILPPRHHLQNGYNNSWAQINWWSCYFDLWERNAKTKNKNQKNLIVFWGWKCRNVASFYAFI